MKTLKSILLALLTTTSIVAAQSFTNVVNERVENSMFSNYRLEKIVDPIVPEPSPITLIAVGGVILLIRKKKV
jgi:hypothetical protein